MCAHNPATGNYANVAQQGYAPQSAYGTAYRANPAHVPAAGYTTTAAPVPVPMPTQTQTRTHSRTPTPIPPVLNSVQVPSGCHAIELVQFWRPIKRDDPFPLHWALFVRTAPHRTGTGPARAPHHYSGPPTSCGNFYELVGKPETYTAQFLPNATTAPEMLADWRGTHIIGWTSPGQLHVFEQVVRQVPVWRHRSDWRCHHWVYDVVRALRDSYQGIYVDSVNLTVLQKHMGRLLEAWENGDI